ncbi:hypothetical protein EJD97_024832, partial [Solanum chilense]
ILVCLCLLEIWRHSTIIHRAWAFEAIPYLRKLFNDYSEEVSQSRILRCLSAKNNPKINYVDLFNPPQDIESTYCSGDTDDIAINVGVDADVNIGGDIGDVGAKTSGEHVHDGGVTYGRLTPFSGHTKSFAHYSSSWSACKCVECKNKEARLIYTCQYVNKSL